jgi:hypothetical protein
MLEEPNSQICEAIRYTKYNAGSKQGEYDKPIVVSATVGVRIGVVLVGMVGLLVVMLISTNYGYNAVVDVGIYAEFCWLGC